MPRDKSRQLEWGRGRRPKVSSRLSVPTPREGSDGDTQVRQTTQGARLFSKLGGRWFSTGLQGEDFEHATIIKSQYTGIGTSNPTHKLHITTDNWLEAYGAGNAGDDHAHLGHALLVENKIGNTVYAKGILVRCGNNSTSARALSVINYAGEVCGHINGDGDAGTIALANASDERLKDNIQDTSYDALDKINGLKLRQFDWKRNGKHIDIGLVAQEVQQIDSRFVDEGDENSLAIFSTNFIYPLLKAVQELSTKLDAMQVEINNLK